MSGDTLPPYDSLETSPPGYNGEPLQHERTLAATPRGPGLIRRPSASLIKSFKDGTVTFTEQEAGTGSPTYNRGAIVSGEIGLTRPENILEVTVKLYGQMSVMSGDWGSTGSTLISDERTLWTCLAAIPEDKHAPCPSIIPFAIRIPSTYTSPDGKTARMPPSFEASHFGVPEFFAECTYSLSIAITKTRRHKFTSRARTASKLKAFTIALNYRPRTRPQRPFIVLDTVLGSLKPVPEEWLQVIAVMGIRLGTSGRPLLCHLLIPSVQTFAIADPIPIHVQISGTVSSLQEVVSPESELLIQKPGKKKTSKSKDRNYYSLFPAPDNTEGVRVRILRQIVAEINGRSRTRTMTIGTGKLNPMPPAITDIHVPNDMTIDWQGEVLCMKDVTSGCGGFSAHGLAVKDFIVLDVAPPRPSFLLPLQISQPIQLVTDSWDTGMVLPQDTWAW